MTEGELFIVISNIYSRFQLPFCLANIRSVTILARNLVNDIVICCCVKCFFSGCDVIFKRIRNRKKQVLNLRF